MGTMLTRESGRWNRWPCAVAGVSIAAAPAVEIADLTRVPVSDFAAAGTAGWAVQAFKGETR